MDLFELVGRISIAGADRAERDIDRVTDTGAEAEKKVSKFGAIAGAVGKGVLVATGAAVTGATALIKNVSSNYGALQQSIGGVETLFKESAQTVIDNANRAYTTAGMSANEYMQQVTSFSASLLQSLGGDTAKAAEYADMAMIDMSDNANKMGTSIENITNAYQGFAKQNYSMLDNLKLGYGGTQKEMFRLLQDAAKIDEQFARTAEFSLDAKGHLEANFSDITKAIHIIQNEMGITGTTALEAGETIEGSFNSLGAAWQNFLAGLGNPAADMKTIVDALGNAIAGAIKNVIPVVNNMVQVLPTVVGAILDSVESLLPDLINTFTELVDKVIAAIIDLLPTAIPLLVDCILTVAESLIKALPQVIDGFLSLVSEIISSVSEMLPDLIPLVVDVVVQVAESIIENAPTILNALLDLLDNLVAAVIEAIPLLIDAIPDLIEGIVGFMTESIPTIIKASVELFHAIIEALPEIIVQLGEALPELITTIVQALVDGLPLIVDGAITLFNGIVEALPVIVDAITPMIPEIIETITRLLVENLPLLVAATWQLLSGLTMALIDLIGSLFADGGILDNIFTAIGDGLSKSGELLAPFLQGIWTDAENFWSDILMNVSVWFSKLITNVIGYLTGLRIKITQWGTNVALKALETGSQFVGNIVSFFKTLPVKISAFISTALGKITEWATNVKNKAVETGSNFINSITTFFSQLPGKISSFITSALNSIKTWVTNVKNKAIEAGSGFINNIVSYFKNLPSKISTWLTSTINKVIGFVTDMKNKAIEAGSNFVSSITEKLSELPNKVVNIGRDVVEGIWNGITGASNWLSEKIGGFVDGVVQGFKDNFKINSPSKVMYPIGEGIDEGVGVSLENSEASENAIKSKFGNIMNVAGKAFGMVQGYISEESKNLATEFDVPTVQIDSRIRNEAIENPVQQYQLDINSQFSLLNDGFERLIGLINEYLPDIAGNMNREIVLDSGALAVGMSRRMDKELGKISVGKGRGNI